MGRKLPFIIILISLFASLSADFDDNHSFVLGLRQNVGRGIGYNREYGTVEALYFPVSFPKHLFPYFDLKGHSFGHDDYAGNAGLGLRFMNSHRRFVFGFNSYYDFRRQSGSNFRQVGAGFEMFAPKCSWYLNGYIPVGEKEVHRSSCFFHVCRLFVEEKKYERALPGVNLDAVPTLKHTCNVDFQAILGAYYYREKVCHDVIGAKVGFKIKFQEFFAVSLTATHDGVFKTRGQAQLALRIPLGKRSEYLPFAIREPYRNDMIVLHPHSICSW